ncbi:hypothetical protein [Bacillus wiedmannii]|uniref:hypothetical protein n=1 Tax=Bacillus wiedmannii TaxID=1890302 RepID=UPI00065C1795|nr:hypothetical protein [Bacillus wiedmannii]KMP23654.1 hypothetical protein TU50_28285 [Bacillus wiedmannii]
MKEGKLEQESKSRKYERIFIISFLTTIVLIIGSIVVVEHTGFKYTMYLAVVIIVSIGITNDIQKRYKKYSNLSNKE